MVVFLLIIIAVGVLFPKNNNPLEPEDYEIDENGQYYPYTYDD